MKIATAVILLSIWFLRLRITNANHRRILRGPPQPPRPPPVPMHHHKKWHNNPHRSSTRPRPIPINMAPFKAPMGPPISQRFHTPNRNAWKNFQNSATEKPFLSSPTINVPEYEYDYHIQTNNIPTQSNTVKQVDEKGPIHTIPAPNLGPADKPNNLDQTLLHRYKSNLEQVYRHINQKPTQQAYKPNLDRNPMQEAYKPNFDQNPTQQAYKINFDQNPMQQAYKANLDQNLMQQAYKANLDQNPLQQTYKANVDQNPMQQAYKPNNLDQNSPVQQAYKSIYLKPYIQYIQQPQYTQVEVQKSHQYQVTESTDAVPIRQQIYFAPDPNPNDLKTPTEQLNAHAEFLVSAKQQPASTQMTPQELYKLITLNPQQQLLDSYGMPLSQQPQLQQHFQRKNAPTFQALTANQVIGSSLPIQPQYQHFNYEEQKNSPDNSASRVMADYRSDPSFENVALAQTQYVQHFFGGDETVANNNVEPDAHVDPKAFFSSSNGDAQGLGNNVQGLGNNVQKTTELNKALPISIYVPDNYEESNEEPASDDDDKGEQSAQNEEEYEETQEDKSERETTYQSNASYGNRLRSRE